MPEVPVFPNRQAMLNFLKGFVQPNASKSDCSNEKCSEQKSEHTCTLKSIHMTPPPECFSDEAMATLGSILKQGLAEIYPEGVAKTTGEEKATGEENVTGEAISTIKPVEMLNVREGYESLADVLTAAIDQAQNGKGNARHQVGDVSFKNQPICDLARLYGTGYNFGQAAKKAHETNQLESKEAKIAELLGAINYLAAAVIVISEQ